MVFSESDTLIMLNVFSLFYCQVHPWAFNTYGTIWGFKRTGELPKTSTSITLCYENHFWDVTVINDELATQSVQT